MISGDFATPPASRGFDWRLPGVEGISFSRDDELRGLRLTFSGRQPEDCETLVQLVAVHSQLPYDMSFAYRTPGLANAKGIAWRITNASGDLAEIGLYAALRDRGELPANVDNAHASHVNHACGVWSDDTDWLKE